MALTLCTALSARAQEPSVAGEYILKMKPAQSGGVHAKLQGKAFLKAAFALKGSFHLSGADPALVEQLSHDPDVEYIEPNFLLQSIETDPGEPVDAMTARYYDQTGAPVHATDAWAASSPANPANRPIVAIIDTGMDKSHYVFRDSSATWVNPGEIPGNGIDDDFNGYVDDVNGWNFITNAPNFADDEGHGTHVAGIVLGATQDILTTPLETAKVRLMPLKFLDSKGAGTTAGAISAMYYAVNMGAKVINCSWGGGAYSHSLHDAMTYAYNHGVMVITAAGNYSANNDSTPIYPANYDVPSNLSVAAAADNDRLASFSNYGASKVPLAAPGVYVYSTIPGGWFSSMSGTSMAAPFVAGVAALAVREAVNFSGYQLRNLLMASVDQFGTLSGKVSTGGRINVLSAVNGAKGQASALAYQPAYTPVYQAERAPASQESSKGGGCGLLSATALQGAGGGGSNTPGPRPQTAPIVFLLFLTPVLAWFLLRLQGDQPASRRRFERYVMQSEIVIKSGGRELVGTLKTISLGGISFNAEEALEKGGRVQMKLLGPDGAESVEVEGHIVWSERNEAYGVQFDQARHSVLSMISGWTKQLVRAK